MNIWKAMVYLFIFIIIPLAFGQDDKNMEVTAEKLKKSAIIDIQKKEHLSAINKLIEAKKIANNEKEKIKFDNSIGWLYFMEGNTDQAENYLIKASEGVRQFHDPDLESKININLGILYFTKGEYDKAKAYFEKPSTVESSISTKYLSIINAQEKQIIINQNIREGIFYRVKGEFEQAVDKYNMVLEQSPNNVSALEYKGYALFRLHRFDESLETTLKAFELDPDNIYAIINLIKVYCAMGKLDEVNRIKEETKSRLPEKFEIVEKDAELQRMKCNQL